MRGRAAARPAAGGARGERRAGRPPGAHPDHWRLLEPTSRTPGRRPTGLRARLLRAVARRPRRPGAGRHGPACPTASTRCGSPTAAPCSASPPATSAAGSRSRTSPPSWPTWPPRPWRRRWPSPAAELGPADAAPAGSPSSAWASAAAASSTTSATSTWSSSPSRPTAPTASTSRPRCAPPPRSPSRLMRACSATHRRGHHLAGRRGAAPRGQGRPAGAHAGQPRRLLPAVGQDLGVPGAAQGPAGGRRPRARPGVRRRRRARWCGRRPTGPTSSPTCRRCAAGSRAPWPTASSHRELKLGPGGLRDVEFAVQLLQLVHGRTDDTPAQPQHAGGARVAVDGRLRRAATTPPRWTAPTASCARSSTGCSCTGCAVPT